MLLIIFGSHSEAALRSVKILKIFLVFSERKIKYRCIILKLLLVRNAFIAFLLFQEDYDEIENNLEASSSDLIEMKVN